jgi:putative resolvase
MWHRGELNAEQLASGTIIVKFNKPLNKGVIIIKVLLNQVGKDVEVVNLATERTDDLMHDFVSIITSFCARLYSIRRRKRKTECLIKCLEEDETDRETLN